MLDAISTDSFLGAFAVVKQASTSVTSLPVSSCSITSGQLSAKVERCILGSTSFSHHRLRFATSKDLGDTFFATLESSADLTIFSTNGARSPSGHSANSSFASWSEHPALARFAHVTKIIFSRAASDFLCAALGVNGSAFLDCGASGGRSFLSNLWKSSRDTSIATSAVAGVGTPKTNCLMCLPTALARVARSSASPRSAISLSISKSTERQTSGSASRRIKRTQMDTALPKMDTFFEILCIRSSSETRPLRTSGSQSCSAMAMIRFVIFSGFFACCSKSFKSWNSGRGFEMLTDAFSASWAFLSMSVQAETTSVTKFVFPMRACTAAFVEPGSTASLLTTAGRKRHDHCGVCDSACKTNRAMYWTFSGLDALIAENMPSGYRLSIGCASPGEELLCITLFESKMSNMSWTSSALQDMFWEVATLDKMLAATSR
mmetsp:Transcript_25939/g.60611  ORF Transcript_25939/g.60611 Transcript_25939/m.60611 type:complete len:434 (+) Transcript_25939:657-1958(+)